MDSLSDTRAAQRRLEAAQDQVNAFLNTYRRYAATAVGDAAEAAGKAAAEADRAAKKSRDTNRAYAQLEKDHAIKQALTLEMAETIAELEATIAGIKGSKAYQSARDLDEWEKRVEALGSAADSAIGGGRWTSPGWSAQQWSTCGRRGVDPAARRCPCSPRRPAATTISGSSA